MNATQLSIVPLVKMGPAVDQSVERNTIFEVSYVGMTYDRGGENPVTTLKDVYLRVGQGDFVCILGPSGCGKTTLLKMLGGFLKPSSGAVLFEGTQLTKISPQVVMIFQEPNLFPWMTVERNISFGPRVSGNADAGVDITELLKTVGLLDARRLYPHQLSGGMKQRAAIARALATRPKALLLDEPFSALDVGLRRKMQDFIRQLWKHERTTMVMVTHSIEEAILCSQRIIVLGGRPSGILEDINVSGSDLKDRYSPTFLSLQQRLEKLIGE